MIDFSEALFYLKDGYKIAREGWNGKGMWICLVPGIDHACGDDVFGPQKPYAIKQGNAGIKVLPRIDMYTAKGEIQIGWLASQSDLLAEDWCIVE